MSRRNRFSNLSPIELILLILLIIGLVFAILSFKAWLLGIVLGWFGVALGFWKNFVIIVLLDLILGSVSTSSKS